MTIDYQRKSLILYIKIILCLTFENKITIREAFVYESVGENKGRGGGVKIVWFVFYCFTLC